MTIERAFRAATNGFTVMLRKVTTVCGTADTGGHMIF